MRLYERMPPWVLEKTEVRTYRPGETILFPEEENHAVYFLTAGTAEAAVESPDGIRATLHLYEAGSCFGELEPFYSGRRPVEITAVTPCAVRRLGHGDFLTWLQSDFEAVQCLIGELAGKLILNAELVERLLSLTVKERLLRSVLLHMRRGTLPGLTKTELAKEINAPIRSLNRAISACEQEGLLSYAGRAFSVPDPERLRKRVLDG